MEFWIMLKRERGGECLVWLKCSQCNMSLATNDNWHKKLHFLLVTEDYRADSKLFRKLSVQLNILSPGKSLSFWSTFETNFVLFDWSRLQSIAHAILWDNFPLKCHFKVFQHAGKLISHPQFLPSRRGFAGCEENLEDILMKIPQKLF